MLLLLSSLTILFISASFFTPVVISLTIPSSSSSSSSFLAPSSSSSSSSLHLPNLTTTTTTTTVPNNVPMHCHPPSRSVPKLCMDDCLDALLLFTMNHPLPSYTLTHNRGASSSDEIPCPYVTSRGSCQLRVDYRRGEGQVVSPTRVFETRVQELVDECVDGKAWGWGGMIGGIDAGGDATVWVEETEAGRSGQLDRRGADGCRLGMVNWTAMRKGGRIDGDTAPAALT